jgi:hypothetical protein
LSLAKQPCSEERRRLLSLGRAARITAVDDLLVEAVAPQACSAGEPRALLDRPLVELAPEWEEPAAAYLFLRGVIRSRLGLLIYPIELAGWKTLRAAAEYLAAELEPPPPPEEGLGAADPEAGGHWAWAPASPEPARPRDGRNPPAVFILSAPRSGSTLLRVMLAGHPRLFSPPELNLLPWDGLRNRALEIFRLGHGWMWPGPVSALAALSGAPEEQAEAQAEAEAQRLTEANLPVAEFYRLLQERAAPRLLVDKSPSYAFHADWLRRAERLFEGARYVHLVRHPRGVMESFVRMRFHRLLVNHSGVWDENPWLFAEKVWSAANRNITRFLSEVPEARQHQLRYEDLVANPRETLPALCDFLGVGFDPAVLNPYGGDRMTHRGTKDRFTIGDPNLLTRTGIDPSLAERWRDLPRLPPAGDVTRDLAARFGYPTDL